MVKALGINNLAFCKPFVFHALLLFRSNDQVVMLSYASKEHNPIVIMSSNFLIIYTEL